MHRRCSLAVWPYMVSRPYYKNWHARPSHCCSCTSLFCAANVVHTRGRQIMRFVEFLVSDQNKMSIDKTAVIIANSLHDPLRDVYLLLWNGIEFSIIFMSQRFECFSSALLSTVRRLHFIRWNCASDGQTH